MGAVEEVKEKVEALKAKISELKGSRADKATVMPLVEEMLAAKKRFEELTGQPYDPPKETTKKVKGPAKMPPPERAPGEKSKKEQQREKKKAQKEAAKAAKKEGAAVTANAAAGVEPSAAPSASGVGIIPRALGGQKCPAVHFCAATPPVVAYATCSLTRMVLDFVPGEEIMPYLHVGDGRTVSGDFAIARYIARSAGAGGGGTAATALGLLGGSDHVEASLVDQWLDLALTHDVRELAATLDAHLGPRTYLAGYDLSLADVAVYLGLWRAEYTPTKVLEEYEEHHMAYKFLSHRSARITGSVQDHPHLQRWFSMVSSVKEVVSATGAVMAIAKPKQGSGGKSVASRGMPGSKPTVPLVQGCSPLEGAVEGQVCTRFPPEPSGYLHIGHVKACLLNQYYATYYKGKMIVRFDDTNPSKEKEEYATSIVQDLATLGVKPDRVSYTSDYFDDFEKYAMKMIQAGDAFMDNTPQEVMKEQRAKLEPSPKRDTPPAESLRLFKLLLKGDKEVEDYCLRAKIDYASVNGTMRDPVMYRMNLNAHHRTGTKYKAYPTYDFACPIVDSVEGVTHACRTTEYLDRDEQYAWFQEKLDLRKVVIHSFARMNFMRTVLSKRHLGWFVEEGRVEGWNDPRFPTVQGVLRRGVRPEALRDFMLQQGASKKVTNMEWDKFWSINKKKYEQTAHRYMGVFLDASVELHITGAPEGDVVAIPVALHPKHPEIGQRAMRLASVVIVEGDDANIMTEGEEVTLKNWGNVRITRLERNESGKVTRLAGEFVPNGDFKSTKKITWLAKVPDLVPMVLVEFDYLVTKDKIEEGENFKDFLNPVTRAETAALGDPGLRNMREGEVVQLERRGFFRADKPYRGEGKPLVLFMIPDGKTQAMSTLSSTLKHV